MVASAEEPEPSETPLAQPALGRRLRTIRTFQGHSLSAVAAGSGLSKSFVATVERGGSDISLGRLYRLLRFYNIGLDGLLTPDAPTQPGHFVVRHGDGRLLPATAGASGDRTLMLAPTPNRLMLPMVSLREPGSHTHDIPPHDGDLFLYILEGALQIDLGGDASFVLHPGDAVYINRDESLSSIAVDPEPTKYIAVIAPPLF